MRKASERILADVRAISRKKGPLTRTPTAVELELASVAEVFLLAQQARIEADYVTSEPVTYTKVASVVKDVAKAFTTWREIRLEPAAQSYLVAMLSK
jgi:hypothetical protein